MSQAPRYRLQKDLNQPEVIAALKAIGCSVWVMHVPADLLCGRHGLVMILEVKNDKKPPSRRKPTPAQAEFNATWRGHRATVTTPQEAIQAVLDHCDNHALWPGAKTSTGGLSPMTKQQQTAGESAYLIATKYKSAASDYSTVVRAIGEAVLAVRQ